MIENLVDTALQLLDESELSSYAIAKATGITETTIGNYRKGRTRPSPLNARILAGLLGRQKTAGRQDDLSQAAEGKSEYTASYTTLLLPIAAQAGSLNDFMVSVRPNECERIVSPIAGVDFALTVTGDSMYPEYPNGSQIFIKKINAEAFIEWGKVYVLDTCNGTIIKELRKSVKPDCVECHSINEDPKYQPFEVCFRDIYGIYRVLVCLSIK